MITGERMRWLVLTACVSAAACGQAETPPASTAAVAISDITYASGFYGPEHNADGLEWRWMGTEGVIRLKNTRRDMALNINVVTPQGLEGAPTVTIEFNGAVLDQSSGIMAFEKKYEVAADKQSTGDTSELVIRTDKSVVPSELGSGNDKRRLGLSISRLSWQPQ
jgi:hypothetical protein